MKNCSRLIKLFALSLIIPFGMSLLPQRFDPVTINGQTHAILQSTNVQVTVQTRPSGRSFTVDGTTYTSTQTFTWISGSSHTIATTSPQNESAGTRHVWDNWSDGGEISHSVAPTSNTTYTANFTTQYFLTMIAGIGGTVSPPSNWFNSGQIVNISATSGPGFFGVTWTGSGPGSFTGSAGLLPIPITMNGPITETATFHAEPVRILAVRSLNPNGGVNIRVSPADNSGRTNAVTPLNLNYTNFTNVTLTAPPTAGGNIFQKWQRLGIDWSTDLTTSTFMNTLTTMTAVYTSDPPTIAVYDPILRAPKCRLPGNLCDSGTGLNGRANIIGGEEPNQPNTIRFSCSDNPSGSYHVEESIDRLRISTLDGGNFAPGKTIRIEATVWASSVSEDFLDLFYAADATNPVWIYLDTLQPSGLGAQILSTTFTLPVDVRNLQAVRANFLRQGSPTPCSSGSNNFDDHDDLIFTLDSAPSTVQFGNTGYTIGEEGSSNTVAILRQGDASGVTTVNYATSDGAGLNNCNVINGNASSRCDYAISIGTVRFAPGETSKIISVPIVDDAYAEGAESFAISLFNPSGSTLGTPGTATITINDNETANGTNPIALTAFFVRQHYLDFLNREPDPPGFIGWQNVINSCPPGDTTCDRVHVSTAFFRSPEFQDRGYFVYRFYPVSFGRKPDYAEFVPDLARVSGFFTAAELESAKVAFVDDFMARPAFVSSYNGLSNIAYVDTLLSTAGVTVANRQELIDALNAGTKTRAQVLREIVESNEVFQRYFNQAFVVMQYFGYLRRDPDALYLNWIALLDMTGDSRTMVSGFINAPEYRFRFGP